MMMLNFNASNKDKTAIGALKVINHQQEKIVILEQELTLTKHALANATEALHGTRQHKTEVIVK